MHHVYNKGPSKHFEIEDLSFLHYPDVEKLFCVVVPDHY
jgi:hypothetical protein